MSTLYCSAGILSDKGRVRQDNEDNACILLRPELSPDFQAVFVVADGAGGHNAGEVASRFVVETLRSLFSSQDYALRVGYSPDREDYEILVLKELLEQMNQELYDQAASRTVLSGMATTATVGLMKGGQLFLGHVGDSRAYLLRHGEIRQLTQDHSWVAEQVQAGVMTAQQASAHRQRNVLTRALGIDPVVRVDRKSARLEDGDLLCLCTDGLTSVVSDDMICAELQSGHTPQETCSRLVNLANNAGGPDNVTVLVGLVSDRPPVQTPHATENRTTARLRRSPTRHEGSGFIVAFAVGLLIGILLAIVAVGLGVVDVFGSLLMR